ncbi:hypothetical protein [Alkalilimnicola sp. S0819]|uniref:hypothetical protein n=1 Tax=Alkalilimnicola sp. S0819 TaxID=2613922 RepID=UPI0012627D94|nr:hypothetical protein [Alkalilimnicola sp. S0819]KAB7619634.1 hypothetical protein F3N43_13100 [Alkalilimnicola sp. S0819]MPQ17571.1 hypothetical protein [Alkalilimnicola sp. S0819]
MEATVSARRKPDCRTTGAVPASPIPDRPRPTPNLPAGPRHGVLVVDERTWLDLPECRRQQSVWFGFDDACELLWTLLHNPGGRNAAVRFDEYPAAGDYVFCWQGEGYFVAPPMADAVVARPG